MKLNNIRLLVNDFDRCFLFYKDILGLEVTWGNLGGVYASFNIGLESGLGLFKADLMDTVLGENPKTSTKKTADRFAIIISVENIDNTYNTLKKRGVEFITEPKDMPDWGIRVAHFRDPEGNLIEVYTDLPK
jgi:catechol 2,3-dioxygenase-like lactoylglutathione lyase family enzyme